jgi:hypothetical protein
MLCHPSDEKKTADRRLMADKPEEQGVKVLYYLRY